MELALAAQGRIQIGGFGPHDTVKRAREAETSRISHDICGLTYILQSAGCT